MRISSLSTMTRLNIRKRVRQLDDAKEVVLGGTKKSPVWTTAGELAMSGDDKGELSAKLRAHQRHILVHKAVDQVYQTAATFLEKCLLDMAPQNVADSYTGRIDDSGALFNEWMSKSPFKFVLDGLTARFFYQGREIAKATAQVDAWIREDVINALKFDKTLGQTMWGAS